MIKYPYSRPTVTDKDVKAVANALKSQFLTGGKVIKSFEKKISHDFGVSNAIVCSSGTAALHLIYKSLGLKKGEAILTTPITFLATASAARMCNAKVYFSDVDSKTGLITADSIEKKLKNKKLNIKIVTVVHLGGRVCDLESIFKITKKYKCHLVEDACHAPGAYYKNKKNSLSRIGSCKYSTACSFSFHAIKHITMAEGGCITTNNKSLNNKIRLKLNHSMQRDQIKTLSNSQPYYPWYYEVSELGWNYRASEINCALGLSQISRLDKIIKKRKKIAHYYFSDLHDFKYVTFPKNAFIENENAWHLFTVFIDFKKYNLDKVKIIEGLEKKGIGSQVHYIPLFMQPYFKDSAESYKGSKEYYEKSLSLPMYNTLLKKDISFITKILKKIILENLKKQRK